MTRAEDCARARQLRADGVSYQEIAAACGIAVSTAWRWTRDARVSMDPERDRRRQRRQHGPMPAGHRQAIRQAVIRAHRKQSPIWQPAALELLASRRQHVDVARRLGVHPSTVIWHRRHRIDWYPEVPPMRSH